MARSATNAAKKVLSKTRGLFVATHWTAGAMSKYDETENKTFYCSVGGLRYIAAGDPEVGAGSLYETREYVDALSALALEIDDSRHVQYLVETLNDSEMDGDVLRDALETLENIVIDWNDDQESAESVVELFDDALARAVS